MSSLGMHLKKERLKRNLTQSAMAEILGLTRSAYSLYESDKREPSLSTLKNMATMLDMSIDSLMEYPIENALINATIHTETSDSSEDNIIDLYHELNKIGQKKAVEQVEMLTKIPEYRKSENNIPTLNAAHARTDITSTSEGPARDSAIMEDESEWE